MLNPMPNKEPIFVKYDAETRKWFNSHPGAQTTVMCCEKCGLWYKPILGHKCKKTRTVLKETIYDERRNP
jgi:hypothetical protein